MSNEKVNVVPPQCMFCSTPPEKITVDLEAYERWVEGELIQVAFPEMSDDDRETLKSGIHGACWHAMFGSMEDEE
jgi:hypothetical protein